MRLWARLAVAVAGLMLAAPACTGHGQGGGSGELRAVQIEGVVTVQQPGESQRLLRKDEKVPAGAGIRTGKDSRVRFEGGSGRAIELGGETLATIVSAGSVALDLGRALGESGSAGSLAFDSRGVGVHVTGGIARVERLLGVLHVGVYSGAARVDLLGHEVDVPAYRELDFAGGIEVDRDPRPLTLKDSDPWDRRLLGDVIDFDRNLQQFGNGFNNEFAGQAVAPAFFSPFVAVSNVSFVQRYLTQEPAEVLIGLVLAERFAAKSGSAVQRLFPPMLDERGQGATWGLIAKERGLELQPLLQSVLDAIRRGTSPPLASGGGGGGGGGNPPRQPGPQPTGSPKPKPTGSPTPGPSPSPTPTPTCGTLERLLGICPPQSGSSSQGAGTPTPPPDCSIVGVLLDPEC